MSIEKRSFAVALCLVVCMTAFSMPQAMAADVNDDSGYTEIMPMCKW